MDAVSTTACSVWCAFQTGNTIQLALGLARTFTPSALEPFGPVERAALCALFSFVLGSFIGRIGDHIGPRKRIWMVLGTFLQAAMTLAACLTSHYSRESGFASNRRENDWSSALGYTGLAFISTSMGLQSAMATRLSTQFSNTVVLTSQWASLVAEPNWFKLDFLPRRDDKIMGIAGLFFGGFTGRALIGAIGVSSALGVGAGLRLLIAFAWYFVPDATGT